MANKETPTWLKLILVSGALLVVAIFGLVVLLAVTAERVHPDPRKEPSVTYSVPPAKFAPAVEQARQIVRTHISDQNLPGVSVAVGINGDIVWAEGFGFADLRESVPVTPHHRFRIGTASVVLTSAAAGLLLQDGRLKLEDPIQKYVPAFPQKQWPVTLRELMGHTAGLISDGGDEGALFAKHCNQPVEALKYFAAEPLQFEPGTQYRYSNYSWIPVSAVIETAAGQPFLEFMRDQVFNPLGMSNTIPDPTTAEDDDDFPLFNLIHELIIDPRTKPRSDPDPGKSLDRATSYFPRFENPNYGLHMMRPLDLSCYAGASVFLSTPSDLVRFGMAINNGKLLKPATMQLLQTSQRLPSGKDTGYGLGWDLESVTLMGKQTTEVGHDGNLLGGMTASLLTFPEQGMAVSLISNVSRVDTFSFALKIAEPFAHKPK